MSLKIKRQSFHISINTIKTEYIKNGKVLILFGGKIDRYLFQIVIRGRIKPSL
jgi:hypothetical protein